jgi:hypothetical protein
MTICSIAHHPSDFFVYNLTGSIIYPALGTIIPAFLLLDQVGSFKKYISHWIYDSCLHYFDPSGRH